MEKKLYSKEHVILRRLLRELRKRSGLRQQQLAKLLGEPQSFVSKYESGERRLDVLELRQICLTLKFSLSKFIRLLERDLKRKTASRKSS